MAMIGEEAFEVDLVGAALGLREADRFDKSLGLLVLDLSEVICVMNAAEVDEIENGAPHQKERLKIIKSHRGGDVFDKSLALFDGELRYA